MGWTLDADNGSIAQNYLTTAGFPASAYNWLEPSELNCCNDVFVMPHADPTWADHGSLLNWNDSYANGGCEGTIWAACHAVSNMENLFNPAIRAQQLNFLSNKTGVATGGGPYANSNSLLLDDAHSDGTPPNTYALPGSPVMQFVGDMDDAVNNGAEQIYIPQLSWRNSTSIGAWDPNHPQATGSRIAAILAYGQAFGDDSRGKVMYQAGHNHFGSSSADNIAAVRAFFNFSFWAAADKSVQVTSDLQVDSIVTENIPAQMEVFAGGGSGSFTYSWSASCGGVFSHPDSSWTEFTAPFSGTCVITCTVTDACGRVSFSTNITDVQVNDCNPVRNKDFIRGVVFRDRNKNGDLDENEPTFSDVNVKVYLDENSNGVLDGSEGNTPVASGSTIDGFYELAVNPQLGNLVSFNKRINSGNDDAHQASGGSVNLTNSALLLNSSNLHVGLKFKNITIPDGAIIETAYIEFTASTTYGSAAAMEISVQESVDPLNFTATNNNISQRWDSDNKVTWNIGTNWVKDRTYNSADISDLVQSIVNNYDWQGGMNMVFVVKRISGTERRAYSYNGSTSKAPRLVVTYRMPEYPTSYITVIDETTLPYGGHNIAGNHIVSTFTREYQASCNKNIGFYLNRTLVVSDVNATFENMPISGSVMRNDIDPEFEASFFSGYLQQNGVSFISSGASLSGIDLNGNVYPNAGTLTFDADGEYNFSPNFGFMGKVSLDYVKCDNGSPAVCDTGKLTIVVNAFPNPNLPETNGVLPLNDYKISYSRVVRSNMLVNDKDPELDGLALQNYRFSSNGVGNFGAPQTNFNQQFTVGGLDQYKKSSNNAGLMEIEENGDFIFTASDDFAGFVELEYNICDDFDSPSRRCEKAYLRVDVVDYEEPIDNLPPFAGDDFATTFVNLPVTVNWISNDKDENENQIRLNSTLVNIDPSNLTDPAAIQTLTTQRGGSITFYKDGTYKYTPQTDYYGPDQLAYRICDVTASPLCDSATIYLLTAPIFYDFGDLPSQYTSAGHMLPIDFDDDGKPDLVNSIWFGEIADHELLTHNSPGANGDNITGMDDEDGLVFPAQGESWLNHEVEFQVKVNGSEPLKTVYFGLWFDWNFDGVFDAFYTGSGVTPEDGLRAVETVIVPVTFPSLSTVIANGMVGVRLRAFQSVPNFNQHSGNLRSGEAEDYIMYLNRNQTLPIELTYFSATAEGNDGILTWQTASELNNDFFSVQRSLDALSWEEIGVVDGKGTTSVVQNYQFTDENLESNTYYYRLQQFDFDGSSEVSKIESIQISGNSIAKSISMYPNPVNAQGTITMNGLAQEVVEINILSVDGSLKGQTLNHTGSVLDLNNFDLTFGTYIIQVKDGANVHSKEIMIYK
jgi:hypothetical protein